MLRRLLSIAMLVAMVPFCGLAAQDEPTPTPKEEPKKEAEKKDEPVRPSRSARMIERFDENGDGKLALSEIPEFMQERFKGADKDGDGLLTAAELDAIAGQGRGGRGAGDGEGRGGRRGGGVRGGGGDGEMGGRGGEGRDRQGRRSGRGGANPAAMLERYDENGDGMLSAAELPERISERLMASDLDKDGFLTVAELEKAESQRREEQAKRTLERLDENADGKLMLDELPDRMRRRYERMDTDKNGELTLKELAAPPASRETDQARNPAQIIERSDKNKDGKLTGDEIPAWMRGRMEQLDKNKDGALTADELQGGTRRGRGGDTPPAEGDKKPTPPKKKVDVF